MNQSLWSSGAATALAASANAPLGQLPLLRFLLAVAALLLLATCLGRIAARFRMPAIVGELLAGVLLGPSVLGHLAPQVPAWLFPPRPDQAHLLDAVAQLGVLLLVGVTGIGVDPGMIRRRSGVVAWVSAGSLVVPLGLGLALGAVYPHSLLAPGVDRTVFAMFLGVALCVSAIPVIAKTLSDLRLLHRDISQLILACGLINDIAGWILLSIVSAMAVGAGDHASRIGWSLLGLVGFLLVAVVVGRPVVRHVLRRSSVSPEAGPTTAATVVIILLGAAATHAIGMEPVLGAFAAGILVGSSGVPVASRLAPLRLVVTSVLAPLFLAGAGLRIDLTALRDPRVLAVAVAVLVVAVVGKLAGAYAGARLSRLGHWEGMALGAGLNARGVVEVIIASVGLQLGILTTATYTTIIMVAVVTSLMAPPLLRPAVARLRLTVEERRRAGAPVESAALSAPAP